MYIEIFGNLKATDRLHLDRNDRSKALFEAGCCDRFDKKLDNIGKPFKIKIGHDNKGSFAGWHLDKVSQRFMNKITLVYFVTFNLYFSSCLLGHTSKYVDKSKVFIQMRSLAVRRRG